MNDASNFFRQLTQKQHLCYDVKEKQLLQREAVRVDERGDTKLDF